MAEELDENVSLMDVAGINFEDITEVRGAPFPEGLFDFEVEESVLDTIETTDKDGNKVDTKVHKITCVPKVVHALKREDVDADAVLERKYFQTFWLRDTDNLGRSKAFIVDIGATGATYGDACKACEGRTFRAQVIHRRNKNDEDNPYVNLRKIEPVTEETQAAAE